MQDPLLKVRGVLTINPKPLAYSGVWASCCQPSNSNPQPRNPEPQAVQNPEALGVIEAEGLTAEYFYVTQRDHPGLFGVGLGFQGSGFGGLGFRVM